MNSSPSLGLIDSFLEDSEDPAGRLGLVKTEPGFMDPYNDGDALVENWPSSDSYDFLDSFLNFDNHFNLNDVDMRATSPSDTGMCSTQSLSSDEQMSPFLPMEEEQEDIINSCPQSIADFDSVNSSNESLESEGSPLWSNLNYETYSPTATDVTVDNEVQNACFIEQSMLDEQIIESIPILEVEPANIDYNKICDIKQNQPTRVMVQEKKLNVPSSSKRNIKQLIRVTPIGSGNPRSILLPVTLKDMKDVKTIKIINSSQTHTIKGYKIAQESVHNKNNAQVKVKFEARNKGTKVEQTECNSLYPPLKLNAEEKRLLQKEGIILPSHYPLTKLEERELKRIRRKIRNKISAQDSRKRKKEYVDGLEDRVKQCHEENMELLNRINVLQTENQNLMTQVKKLQAFIQKEDKSAQPTTCLLILLLSLALVAVPNLHPHSSSNSTELSQEPERTENIPSLTGRSRTLLSTHQLIDEEMQQFEEDMLPEVEGLLDHDYSPMSEMPPSKKCRFEIDKQSSNCAKNKIARNGNFANLIPKQNYKYIELPLDDVWPPPKPGEHELKNQHAFYNDLKLNKSKIEETRTVLLKVPQKQ